MKRPAFQFYPGDWQRDAALRSCSVGARGLWIEMMCVMHQAEPYGYLVLNGNPIEPEQLARMVGASAKEVTRWLGELNSAGVNSNDEKGVFSRRMVRDEYLRNVRASGGVLGGNPALVGEKVEGKVNGKVNHSPTIHPTPSSSSSSSTSIKVKSRTSAQSAKAPMSLRLGEGQVLETIPLVGEAIAEVCQTHLEELERLYPGVDPLPTLREIRGWNLANPARRKTARGIASHINAWFQRDQNRS